jgi:hypothetical protein
MLTVNKASYHSKLLTCLWLDMCSQATIDTESVAVLRAGSMRWPSVSLMVAARSRMQPLGTWPAASWPLTQGRASTHHPRRSSIQACDGGSARS